MKQRSPYPQNPTAWLRRALFRTNRVIPATGTALLAIGLFSAPKASADVVAGWESWSDAGGKTYNASIVTGATGQAVGTSSTGTWNSWNNSANSNGASIDGTWGTVATATPPTTDATSITAAVGLLNATSSGEMTFTVTNTSGGDLDLTGFYFDGGRTRTKGAKDWTLSILAGSAVTETADINSGVLPINLGPTTGNFDTDLTGLADRTLADGESVIFQLAFTGGAGDSAGGNNAMIDNVAVTADSAIANKLAITSVPASAVAGTDFSVTVQAQDNGGSPLIVTQNTEIQLVPSGSGTLSGNTATILTGNSSVTLDFVQYTVAETITLSAGAISGDVFSSSAPSSSIDILAGPASQLIVETAADGSGVPVAAQTVYPGDSLTVYAISRDAQGNFISNSADSWSLANITGSVDSGDLVDNTGGSATFTGNGLGTANIRAALSGLADADSGLITVEPFVHRWTGAGANGDWGTAGSWSNSVLPAFDPTTDLYFSASTNTKGSPYIGANRTVRSIAFDTDSTPATFNISFVLPGNLLPADLTLETDSPTEPTEIIVDAAFTKVLTMGFTPTTEGNQGNLILADDLLVTHDGAANFVLNADITENGGSYGITKAGTGTLIISGTNSYTGGTSVSDGTLVVDGTSLSDNGKLTINGGIVDVTGIEVVAELDFGSGPVAEGTYGATDSGADTIDDVHFTGTGVVSVIIPTPAGYVTWAGDNVGGQSPSEDFNLDGVDNGIAYFMNDTGMISLPGVVGGAVTWSNGGNIPASAYNDEFVVETSQDLADWTPVDIGDLTTNTDGPAGSLTYTLPTGQGKWFVRLTVTPN